MALTVFVLFPGFYREFTDAWEDVLDKEVYEMADRVCAHQQTLRDFAQLQSQLRENRVYDVSNVLQDQKAQKFWVTNFGANQHAVETGRLIETILFETDAGINSHTNQARDAIYQLLFIESYCEKVGVGARLLVTSETKEPVAMITATAFAARTASDVTKKRGRTRDENKEEEEKKEGKKSATAADDYDYDDDGRWYRCLFGERRVLKESQLKQKQFGRETLIEDEYGSGNNSFRLQETTEQMALFLLYPSLPPPERARLKGLSNEDQRELNQASLEVTRELKKYMSGSMSPEKKNYYYHSKVIPRYEEKVEAIRKHLWQKWTSDLKLSVMRLPSYQQAKEFMNKIQANRSDLKGFAKKTSQRLTESLLWLSQGDYYADYLRLESKRKMVHQVMTSLMTKKSDQNTISAYEFQEFLHLFGNLDFVVTRTILSLIRICHGKGEEKARSNHKWFVQPYLALDNKDLPEVKEDMRRLAVPKHYIIKPAQYKKGVMNLVFMDAERNVNTAVISNVPEKARFKVLTYGGRRIYTGKRLGEGELSGVAVTEKLFFSLRDLIQNFQEEVSVPFIDPEKKAKMNVRGTTIHVGVGMFLHAKFRNTRLFEFFHVPSELHKPMGSFWIDQNKERLCDREMEVFNVILNIYRYCSEENNLRENAIIPSAMPSAFYELLKQEFEYWKMPYNVSRPMGGRANPGFRLALNPRKKYLSDAELARKERDDRNKKRPREGALQSDTDDDGSFGLSDGADDDDIQVFVEGNPQQKVNDDVQSQHQLPDHLQDQAIRTGSQSCQGFNNSHASGVGSIVSSHSNPQSPGSKAFYNSTSDDCESIEEGRHAYEVLQGLPLFHEDPKGIVLPSKFHAGQSVQYLSKTTGKWFDAVVESIDLKENVTVTLKVSKKTRVGAFDQLKPKITREVVHGYMAAPLDEMHDGVVEEKKPEAKEEKTFGYHAPSLGTMGFEETTS